MQPTVMTKELVFKMRLSDDDRKRLDRLAEHYSSPAATVVRMLIKERTDSIPTKSPLRLQSHHIDILEFLKSRRKPVASRRIDEDLTSDEHAYGRGVWPCGEVNNGLADWLSELERAVYVAQVREDEWMITEHGRAAIRRLTPT